MWQGFCSSQPNLCRCGKGSEKFANLCSCGNLWQGFCSSLFLYDLLLCCRKIQWRSETDTVFFLFHAGERKIQPTFGCKTPSNHLQHILRLAEEERVNDSAIESEQSMSVTPSLAPPLPPPMPPPRAVCRLTMDNQQADSPLPWSPSPEHAASPVVEEAPASPIVHCSESQYSMKDYERQNGPLPGHYKVGG